TVDINGNHRPKTGAILTVLNHLTAEGTAFTFSRPVENGMFSLFGANGRELMRSPVNGSSYALQNARLPAGAYVARLTSAGQTVSRSFTLTR
ncbi:MAG: T9SS type A sorting domain-containing protein, partial [Chitinispirillaceae bacterium]|nr:T9SS type A sorting domain-containing protein [Chitinispirillaceae bacterium]